MNQLALPSCLLTLHVPESYVVIGSSNYHCGQCKVRAQSMKTATVKSGKLALCDL